MFGSPANESNEKLEWRLMFSPGFLVHESCGTVLRVMGKIPHSFCSETRNVRDSEIVVPN